MCGLKSRSNPLGPLDQADIRWIVEDFLPSYKGKSRLIFDAIEIEVIEGDISW